MKLAEGLQLKALQRARLVAGAEGLEREVRWVHVVDLPDPVAWVRPGMLLLTTGYAWPRQEQQQRALIRALAERRLAGIGMAVPQFFEHFPAPACAEADAAGLPLIEIPWEIPFAQITEEMHGAILAEQYGVIEQSESIHRELTRAALETSSLQELAGTLGRLIRRAVTFEDREGHLLAYHTIEGMEDHVRHSTLQRGQSPAELWEALRTLGYLDAIYSSAGPLRIPGLPELGLTARVVCPVRLKRELVGLVWIIEGSSPLSELDLRAAEHAAIVAALQIAHQRALASLESRLGYAFLDSLIEGRFDATAQALERAQLLGFDAGGVYRVGLFVLDVAIPLSREGFLLRERLTDRLRARLHDLGSPPLLSVSLNQVPFLLSGRCAPEPLWDSLAEPGLALALSRPHQGPQGVRRGYLELLSMLPHMRGEGLYRYEGLLLPRVLAGDAEARHSFLEELLGELRRTRNGHLLVSTLLALARAGFHLKRTSEVLCIHPKTLRYRLERAAEISGLDLEDAEIRFRLQLAAHLLSVEDKILA